MSAMQQTAGYPVHAVAQFSRTTNDYGAKFTDWAARCDAHGTMSGHGPFGTAGSARERELCPRCFPQGHATLDVKPVQVTT